MIHSPGPLPLNDIPVFFVVRSPPIQRFPSALAYPTYCPRATGSPSVTESPFSCLILAYCLLLGTSETVRGPLLWAWAKHSSPGCWGASSSNRWRGKESGELPVRRCGCLGSRDHDWNTWHCMRCFQMGKVNPIERLHRSGSFQSPGAVGVSIMSKSPPNFVCHVPSKYPHGKPSLGAKGREWACSISEQQRAGRWSTPSSNLQPI
jgi:hypothetical protein